MNKAATTATPQQQNPPTSNNINNNSNNNENSSNNDNTKNNSTSNANNKLEAAKTAKSQPGYQTALLAVTTDVGPLVEELTKNVARLYQQQDIREAA